METEDLYRTSDLPAKAHETSLPLHHQPAWVSGQQGTSILSIRSTSGDTVSSVAVQRERSRALPGHVALRIARFGHGWPRHTWEPVIEALASQARADSRILAVNLEVFLREGHKELREILQKHGFVRTEPRSYRHTLTLDVNDTDEALLSSRKSVRKRLREAEKAGVEVRELVEPQYAERLAKLQRIAMERSGGNFRIPDWVPLLQLSAEHPEFSRIVGLFLIPGQNAPEELLAFAWGCMHGDHADYRAAGTADMPPALKHVSVTYPLVWNLIRWSRENGATWFDMGGVTVQEGAEDPLAGISSVKRVFSETVEEVGEEWMLEPRPWKSRAVQGLKKLATKLSSIRGAGASDSR